MKKTISVTFDAGPNGDSCANCPIRSQDDIGDWTCPFAEGDVDEEERFKEKSIRTTMCRMAEVGGCESWEDELHG